MTGRTGRGVLWAFALITVAVFFLVRSLSQEPVEPPGIFGELPVFELVDQDGEDFGSADLAGRIWIANFIFTSCGEVCPRLTTRMHQVQTELEKKNDPVLLVSISVDPKRDTPEVLRDYAQRFGADLRRWSFLTGPLDAIESTVVGGFKMVMQRTEDEDTGFFNIVHGERFILVDGHGRIRGYYEAGDEGLRELVADARLLVEIGNAPAGSDGPA